MESTEDDPLLTEIKQTLAANARELLKAVAAEAPGEHIYAIVFNDGSAAAATEEALARTAVEYRESGYEAKSGDTDKLLRALLRWDCLTAFAYDSNLEGALAFAQKIRAAAENSTELLDWAGAEILKEMDAAGEFGTGEAREKIVLGITRGTMSVDDFVKNAEPLNPPAVIERLKAEIESGKAANTAFDNPWKDQ